MNLSSQPYLGSCPLSKPPEKVSLNHRDYIVQGTSPRSGHVACFPNIAIRLREKLCSLAHWPEGTLSGEHHWGAPSTKPGIVVRSFRADDATDGHEESI